MQIKDFIIENTHLSNEELILLFAKIAYNKGWQHRDGEGTIDGWTKDIEFRNKWLNSLINP